MFREPIAALLVTLVVSGTTFADPPKVFDGTTETMSRMRLLGAAVETHRLENGTFPKDDGKLRPLASVLGIVAAKLDGRDAWRTPLLYRANAGAYEIISLGPDRKPSEDYDERALRSRLFTPVEESTTDADDIVFADGRFVRRPFGDRGPEITTINAMNQVFVAAAAFAIDNNRYPGDAVGFTPVAELAADLVPIYIKELPTLDGWDRPLLYAQFSGALTLASFGSDGKPDRLYYPDLPCGLTLPDEAPSAAHGADIIQACGQLIQRPIQTE